MACRVARTNQNGTHSTFLNKESMRTTAKYISAAIAGILVLASCDGNEINALQGIDGPHISLTVNIGDPQLMVKSAVDGEDTYNENLMNSIHYFFFAKGSTTSTAVVKGSASGISKTDSYTEEIPVSTADLNGNLFGADRKCSLFVIANAPESMNELISGNPTLAQLRAAAVISNMNKVPQSNFVMVYDDEIEIDSRADKTAIDVEIEMERLACKFTFKADVKKSLSTTDGSKTIYWTAAKDSEMGTGEKALTVTFCNGVNKTTPAGFNKSVVKDEDYFETDPVGMSWTSEDGTGDDALYHYEADAPIYSYPMDWVFTDQFEPYILFDLVWNYDDGSSQHQEHRYYKMVLGQQSITSNDWYVITAKLTALGNLLPRDPMVLFSGLNYSVYKWNNAFQTDQPNTPANIKAARYLMVPQTEFEIQNETSVEIPFMSSHLCEISNITVTKKRFYRNLGAIPGTWPETVNVLTNVDADDDAVAIAGFTFTIESDKVKFEHALHNDIDQYLDHSPYTITFTLKQGDTGADLSQIITITQYPAIWIEYEKNSATNKTNGKYGYAYFNNTNDVTANKWNKISGRGNDMDADITDGNYSSASPYMVIFHVSQFADGNYIIGDPRVKTAVTMSSFWSTTNSNSIACQSAPAKYDKITRTLKDYYPTEDGADYYNYIAPVLRVTSAVGRQSYPFPYEQTKVACSSYQEDGYPAGRWRLPTAAEALFINKMANDFHMICPLYSTDQYYWCAGGYLYGGVVYYNTTTATVSGIPPANSTSTRYNDGTANTRCVYDEWYWSEIDKEFGWTNSWSGTDYNKISPDNDGKGFVWGDMPRNYTHPSH